MERGGDVPRYNKLPISSSSSAGFMQQGDGSSSNSNSNTNIMNMGVMNENMNNNIVNQNGQVQAHNVVREQDQYMPIANVIRIMRRILPAHAKISDDAKETIQECVSEYISFVTGEANERCQREQRKTITAEDVLWAMGKLGFDDYVEPLTLFLNRYRESESDRTSLRGEPVSKRVVDYGPVGIPTVGPFGPLFPTMPHQQGLFDAAAMGAFFKDGSPAGAASATGGGSGGGGGGGTGGASSSQQNAMTNFDPFAPFK